MQKEKIDIVVISSVLNSDTLNEWFSLMLQCLSDTTRNRVAIVSPYSREKLDYAIQTFHTSNNFHSFIQIVSEDTSYSEFEVKINRAIESLSDVSVDRIFSIFSPCQGDKTTLTNIINVKLDAIDITSNRLIPFDKYQVESSSMLMYRLIKHFEDAKLFHFILDPQEVDMSLFSNGKKVTSIFAHQLPNAVSHPFILYNFADSLKAYTLMSLNDLRKTFETKKNQFVFGLTAFNQQRIDIVNQCKHLNGEDIKFYYYGTFDGEVIDTRIKYSDYLKELDSSLSTLVIPAYDPTSFSLHRFIESLANGCIPLIYQADYKAGFDYDAEMISIAERHLLIKDINDLHHHIQYVKENWFNIFIDLLTSEYVSRLMSKSNYINSLSEIID